MSICMSLLQHIYTWYIIKKSLFNAQWPSSPSTIVSIKTNNYWINTTICHDFRSLGLFLPFFIEGKQVWRPHIFYRYMYVWVRPHLSLISFVTYPYREEPIGKTRVIQQKMERQLSSIASGQWYVWLLQYCLDIYEKCNYFCTSFYVTISNNGYDNIGLKELHMLDYIVVMIVWVFPKTSQQCTYYDINW